MSHEQMLEQWHWVIERTLLLAERERVRERMAAIEAIMAEDRKAKAMSRRGKTGK